MTKNMIGCDFHYREKIPVGILGATGSVGQRFVQLLANHPWFEIKDLAASDRSAKKTYQEAANWQMPDALPSEIAKMEVKVCEPNFSSAIVFSGLDASCAKGKEVAFAEKGYMVISNSRNHRMDPKVPLLVPEVNSDHIKLLDQQQTRGKILTNPNCSVIGLAMALKPLEDAFGLEAVHVVTMQAISGAGFRGRKTLDIEDNIIPFIEGEEQKLETELHKVLGNFDGTKIQFSTFAVSAQCNRVPVSDGHMQCVSVKLKKRVDQSALIEAWENFQGEPQELKLPSAPERPIYYFRQDDFPQTKHHRDLEGGMAVAVGRVRKCQILDYQFVTLSHNTVRGAAGCAILNAELLTKKGFIFW